MDSIELHGIRAYGYHGVFPEEQRLGQEFVADVRLEADLDAVGRSDDLADGIDYGAVHAAVCAALTGSPSRTLEHLVTGINARLLAEFPRIERVTTKVYKPHAPLAGTFDYVAVERTANR